MRPDADGAGGLAEDGHPARVPPEGPDVGLYPPQGEALVPQPDVARGAGGVLAHGALRRKLFAFEGVSVGAGETRQVHLRLTSDALAVANAKGERIVSPGVYRLVFEGPDSAASHVMLNTTLTVDGQPRVLSTMPL